ncbi:MAG: DUF3786 domain-containing protein [Nitrospirota bacterium]|nr:DUF3786 domain-containing protein [Nitrospirota bacterium]
MTNALEHIVFSAAAERIHALYNEEEDALLLAMLGQEYVIRRNGITLRGQKVPENHEQIITDYLRSEGAVFIAQPWRSLAEVTSQQNPAFRKTVEGPLAQHAAECMQRASIIMPLMDAQPVASAIGSELAFVVRALPKVHLHVELSREDQEFPAEAWVLFSHNAGDFLKPESLLLLGEVFRERLLGLLRIY